MRTVLPTLLLSVLMLVGCSDGAPFCGLPADITGRLTVYCDDPRQDPVCDYEGDIARYEDTASGLRLVGGELAGCDRDDEIACTTDTVGPPRCITDPEL